MIDNFPIHCMEVQPEPANTPGESPEKHVLEHVLEPMYIMRDEWDLVSLFHREMIQRALKNENSNVSHLIPLCFTRVKDSGFVYIVRLQSIPGDRFYDVELFSCESENFVQLLKFTEVISKYVRMTRNVYKHVYSDPSHPRHDI